MTNALVIGSGPAGLTSSIYLVRAGIDTTVIAGNEPGGQLIFTTDVENFPGFPGGIMGPDLMIKMREQAEKVGAKVIDAAVVEVNFDKRPFVIKTADKELIADTVIIATGASAMWLGLESEEKLKQWKVLMIFKPSTGEYRTISIGTCKKSHMLYIRLRMSNAFFQRR